MTDHSFEQRVAAAIEVYADQAPIDVDALTMARLAVARSRRIGPVWFGSVPGGRGLIVLGAVMALLVTMLAGAFVAGSYLREDGLDRFPAERTFVEPFIGLPPVGASPSLPETGELVREMVHRVPSFGYDLHAMWLYADGRLIWKRNLDALNGEGRRAFGGTEPTNAVIEQRLTAQGVELLRSERSLDRLANPASWLPEGAWSDRRIGAYVPRRYSICLDAPNGLARLPGTVSDIVRATATKLRVTGDWSPDSDCYGLTTEDARGIATTLEEAGIHLDKHSSGLASSDRRIFVFPVTPDGQPICVTCG
jgi:hypothetical protein